MTAAAPETDILWFLPTHGDGRYLGTSTGARHVTLSYLGQIARAADKLGCLGVLPPLRATPTSARPANTGPSGEVIVNVAAPARRAVVQAAHP